MLRAEEGPQMRVPLPDQHLKRGSSKTAMLPVTTRQPTDKDRTAASTAAIEGLVYCTDESLCMKQIADRWRSLHDPTSFVRQANAL